MKKRIYGFMLTTIISSIILTTILLSLNFYATIKNEIKNEMENKAFIIEKNLDKDNSIDYLEKLELYKQNTRITLISKDGKVLYDNIKKSSENHINREEILEAKKNGQAFYTRNSKTIGEKIIYFALQLQNGDYLRISKTTNSIFKIFMNIIPFTVLTIILVIFLIGVIAKKIAINITKPLNNYDFSNNNLKIYDEIKPFIQKIKNQKEEIEVANKEIVEKNKTLKLLTDSLIEGLILLDNKNNILLLNKSSKKILNLNIDQNYTHKNIISLLRSEELFYLISNLKNKKISNINLKIENKIYNIYISNIEEARLLLFVDMTDKINLENRRKEFSANVSHELKTPLTSILGYSELLENNMIQEADKKNTYKKIRKESQNLISLINDIIKLSRLDENFETDKSSEFEKIDINSTINQIIENLSFKIKNKNIDLSFDKNKNTIEIFANRIMIYEMLFNIIDNAISYNKENGEINISIYKNKISIKDTGIGIEKHELDRVFERFYRVDKSRSKINGGTGLGLSIVKHIVEYHNYKIEIKSEFGKGSEVIIYL